MPSSDEIPDPQGRFAGVLYDFRWPTRAQARARCWNPGDRHLLTPKTLGLGFDLNLYWVAHPVRFARGRRP